MNVDSEYKAQAETTATAQVYESAHYASTDHYAAGPVNDSKAIASMVVGLVGIVVGFGLCLGPVAICLGLQAKRTIQESHGSSKGEGFAIVGIVTGVISLVLGIVSIIVVSVIFARFGPDFINVIFNDDDFFTDPNNT